MDGDSFPLVEDSEREAPRPPHASPDNPCLDDDGRERTAVMDASMSSSRAAAAGVMSRIIDHVFLGDFQSAEHKSLLVKHNIKYIFNVAAECVPSEGIRQMGIFIHKYKVYDDSDISLDILDGIYESISSIDPRDGNVLVHCAHGRSRSVTVVLYVLMKKYEYSLQASLDLVRTIRPSILPSPIFLKLLTPFDPSFDIDGLYIDYLRNNVGIDVSDTNFLLDIVKENHYDMNRIVNILLISESSQ